MISFWPDFDVQAASSLEALVGDAEELGGCVCAQVEAFQNVANDRYPGAKRILIVAGTAPENRGELDTVAHGAGVDVVWTSSGGVSSIRESLQSAGVVSGGTVVGRTQAAH